MTKREPAESPATEPVAGPSPARAGEGHRGIPENEGGGGSDQSAAKHLADPQNPRRGLLKGNRAVEDARAARLKALETTEGVLAELRRKVLSGGDTAAIAAAKSLLEVYATAGETAAMQEPGPGEVCPLCNLKRVTTTLEWIERAPDPPMSPSVRAWLDGLPDAPDKPNGSGK